MIQNSKQDRTIIISGKELDIIQGYQLIETTKGAFDLLRRNIDDEWPIIWQKIVKLAEGRANLFY